ncbi:MAG: bifunctional acetaldehyde-CoA/alcohol dehydrogenase [Eubacteriales bacterium]|nr:bifunctional acetaldehyde-CoA/alcohol dehydrogenase [Eubacteriales bacterium]
MPTKEKVASSSTIIDKEELEASRMVDELANRAEVALDEYMKMDQDQVDEAVHAMALAGTDNHMYLAKLAVEETGRGVVEDKIIKNMFATESIWNSIKNQKTVGVVNENELEGFVEVAEPVGIIAGVTPVTNPTSTTMFKCIIAAKTRNPIIFGFHPASQRCSVEAARIMRDAAIKAGAPKDCIQWIEKPSVKATNALMNHPKVSLVLATGGSSMVKAAYSAGKPALGVGPGNVPCYVEKSANLERAVTDIILSKTLDNGMICASEQAIIADKEISQKLEQLLKEKGCHFTDANETELLTAYAIDSERGMVNPDVVGKKPVWIAKQAGFDVPENTKILIAKLPEPSRNYPLSLEKLSPILAYFEADDVNQAFDYASAMLDLGGLGHSAVVHTENEGIMKAYGQLMRVGRVMVNTPCSQGAIGDLYNTNTPSLTLGCGSYGRNSTTSNVSTVNLINKKRLSKRRVNMQWFRLPPKIFFEWDSIQYLAAIPNISRAFIVTDEGMVKLGYVDKILYYLRKREIYCHSDIFSDVEPDPSVETIRRGVAAMKLFNPDVIIALGGGSAMDAAKAMWLFYEHPETSFENLRLRFLDIRKRTFPFPHLGKKAQLVAIPTTSGTGSEVTGFSVITDKQNGDTKYPLADYELTPDVAIIDPQFVTTLPKTITADTGLDVLTHAIEAYVSVLASDYTDALALKAIELVFDYLPRAYENGEDLVAREKMHNASCIAGMAFTNAFLGINHSLAHKLGGEFHIPHGRANAVLLPCVIEYNSQQPTKYVTFPKYEKFIAPMKYLQIAQHLNLPVKDEMQGVEGLANKVRELMNKLGMPTSLKECGVSEKEFFAKLPTLAEKAFEDQCTTANPRYPLMSELEEIYTKAYYGN